MKTIIIKRRNGKPPLKVDVPSTLSEASTTYGDPLTLQLIEEAVSARYQQAVAGGSSVNDSWKPELKVNRKIKRMVTETESFLNSCSDEEQKLYLIEVKNLVQSRQS